MQAAPLAFWLAKRHGLKWIEYPEGLQPLRSQEIELVQSVGDIKDEVEGFSQQLGKGAHGTARLKALRLSNLG